MKRSFPRPKASAVLGLEQDGPFSMQNTISTNNNNRENGQNNKNKRVELLLGNDINGNNVLISSIENSSTDQQN